jgi:thiol-disulfide isomerase/thioredoxin
MAGLIALVGALVVASAAGVWLRGSGRRLGRSGVAPSARDERLTAEDLGSPLGERATLVHFSTAFCQPCRATRRLLTQVSDQVDGVRHVEVDAESALGLVRRLDIRRTPTVLVLDRAGRIVRRASGQPRTPDVVAALGHAIEQ